MINKSTVKSVCVIEEKPQTANATTLKAINELKTGKTTKKTTKSKTK